MDFTEDDNYISMYALVCNYLNCSFVEANQLPCDLFMLSYRNAIIEKMMQSEEGMEKLKKYNRLNQTTPNMERLKERFGGD